VRILKDFKSSDFVSADFRGVTGVFFGSADCKRVSGEGSGWTRCRAGAKGSGSVRISSSDNTGNDNIVVT
jgi:hypothetical protein